MTSERTLFRFVVFLEFAVTVLSVHVDKLPFRCGCVPAIKSLGLSQDTTYHSVAIFSNPSSMWRCRCCLCLSPLSFQHRRVFDDSLRVIMLTQDNGLLSSTATSFVAVSLGDTSSEDDTFDASKPKSHRCWTIDDYANQYAVCSSYAPRCHANNIA